MEEIICEVYESVNNDFNKILGTLQEISIAFSEDYPEDTTEEYKLINELSEKVVEVRDAFSKRFEIRKLKNNFNPAKEIRLLRKERNKISRQMSELKKASLNN